MQFDRRYFENEIRDGFLVPSTIKHAWAAQLEILEDLDKLCKRHNIQYFAEWGTMLGTVRHHGYIPWDDDLDIVMKRDDYMRFMEIAEKELPEEYHLVNFYNENGFTDYLTRIVNSYAITFEPKHLEKYHQFPYSCGIDIFVMDYRAQDEEEDQIQVQQIKDIANYIETLQQALRATGKDPVGADEELRKKNDSVYLLCETYYNSVQAKYQIKMKDDLPLIRKLYVLSDGIMAQYSDTAKYPNPKRITIMALWAEFRTYDFPAEYYERFIEVPYETFKMPLPLYHDTILRKKYGDYWRLIRKGSSHDYPYFKEQEKVLWENMGTTGEWCSFSEAAIDSKEKKNRRSFQICASEYYSLLERFTNLLMHVIQEFQYEAAGQILPKGQELAVNLGTFLETVSWNGFVVENGLLRRNSDVSGECKGYVVDAVSELETYCELLYEINTYLIAEAAAPKQAELETLPMKLLRCLKKVHQNIDKLLIVKRVLFLLRTPEDWTASRKMLRRYKDGKKYLLQFLFIPTYEKRPDGSHSVSYIAKDCVANRVELTDGENITTDELILDEESYNPYEQFPDEIYICDPFDNCNPDYTVDKKYYSVNLLECTRNLIFLPSLIPLDFEQEDVRAFQNMDYYVTMPAAINADVLVIATPCLRERYLEKLTQWSGEKWQNRWEGKVYTAAEWIGESDTVENDVPSAESEIKKEPKTLAFFVSASSFFVKAGCEDKIRECFTIYENYKDKIEILWIRDATWDILEKEIAEKNDTMQISARKYLLQLKELETEFMKKQFGRIMNETEFKECLDTVDAFYGDAGWVCTELVVRKKPTMIMNVDCK